MSDTFKIPLFDLLLGISSTIDLVDHSLSSHQKRVAFMAFNIGREMGLSYDRLDNLVVAGIIHDIGVLTNKEKSSLMKFDVKGSFIHAEIGYQFLKRFDLFKDASEIIRHHHMEWNHGVLTEYAGEPIHIESHIIHLADRVDSLLENDIPVLNQVENIYAAIEKLSGDSFAPEVVAAFKAVSTKESFWFGVVSPYADEIFSRSASLPILEMDLSGLENIAKLFARLIDFRSRFTSTHSSGVAMSAEALARASGFAETDCSKMRIAGYLHDLGKLGVPLEILEKPGFLNKEEMDIIKGHVYYTYVVLQTIGGIDDINEWASSHHEQPNGGGYPFRYISSNLPNGAKIMAVADIFTALMEERPYRKGMTLEETINILEKMANEKRLDGNSVKLLVENLDAVDSARIKAQATSNDEYQEFIHSLSRRVGADLFTD